VKLEKFKISEEEYNVEKEKHLEYLKKNNFKLDVTEVFISDIYKPWIIKNGSWCQALEEGEIKPITESQYNILQHSKGEKNETVLKAIEWYHYKKVQKDWSPVYLLLKKANKEELAILSSILKIKSTEVKDILKSLDSSSQTLNGFMSEDNSYRKIVLKVVDKLKLDNNLNSIKEFERSITTKVLNDALNKMTEEQRANFENEVLKLSEETGFKGLKAGAVFATLGAAQLSGFGVYLLATTTLSTLSGIVGVTLPFAAYTGLTSYIAFLTGPVGWIGAGVYALWKLTDVDYKKVIPVIIYLGWLREKYNLNV
jgi:uncharacterized protein YaaW (UPF0174 family)